MFGPELIEARLQLPVRPFTGAEPARPLQRNDAARLVHVGEHQACRVTIAPDHARQAGDALARDFDIHLVGDKGRAFEFDLRPEHAEVAHDASDGRVAGIERDYASVVDAISGLLTPL